ncbi:hypothetical protein POM88_013561 [Heracleum sosnowskyi]|uniref:Uncharacterized protein n=1 Tax=Heracleum sosnowskyi TaxID=360622 RepID=A0AAD8IYT5_9APIA|nr:hypothetical protein POM88_013561 [Heracleum sosnowskyi]
MSKHDFIRLFKFAHIQHAGTNASCELAASLYFLPDLSSMQYLYYGAAASEELDSLCVKSTLLIHMDWWANSTWTYKIPTINTISNQFKVECRQMGLAKPAYGERG